MPPTAMSGDRPANPLLVAPILPTLLRLATPNVVAMAASAAVAIAETAYVGLLGTASLAGMALVFPMVMLQQMLSAGAMGGGVSSAVARASSPAVHAAAIGGSAGLAFLVLFLGFGREIYTLLGGRGAALEEALAFSDIAFLATPAVWLTNTFASVIRGGGNMKVPSATLLTASATQMVVGGCLGLGLGPFPRLGMAGVALGQVVAFGLAMLFFLWLLGSGRARVPLSLRGLRLRRAMFDDILRVGALAALSPLQSVLTVLILTRLVAGFGTEALAGYGVGARLEFLLVPVTFAIGVACVPLTGMAIGAGDVARARRVAWTGGGLSFAILLVVGGLVAVFPDLWARLFSDDIGVLDAARSYLAWSGPGYGFFGLGLCLYFASQGAGKVLGPVLAGTLRLAVVAAGGWWLAASAAPAWAMFALVGASMVVYGLAAALAVRLTPWGSRGQVL
jgi:Na+-driven multidrug efflux pump